MRKVFLSISINICLLLVISSLALGSQDKSIEEKVDALFEEWNKQGSPGASLAVSKDGKVVYKKGYGYSQLEYDIKIEPSTIFHVSSVSKQFTAFSIVLLADQGKLSLDDEIQKHIPEVPDFGKKITLRHLIHHISGMRDQWGLLSMAGWRLDDVITKEHIMTMVKHQKELNFDPGTQYTYCNTGYTLLAEVVDRITGKSFPEWTMENIFKPLGMTSTHFHSDHQMIVKNRAYSYSNSGDGFRKSVLNFANVGATSLFTTAEDLTKWMRNFENPIVGNKAVNELMVQKAKLNEGKEISYAFGVFVSKYRGAKTVSHGGRDAGFRSHFLHFPDQKFGVVVLSNFEQFSPSRLAFEVADLYLQNQLEPVNEPKKREQLVAKIKLTEKQLESYKGRYKYNTGMVVVVDSIEGKLYDKVLGQDWTEMFPVAKDKFARRNFPREVVFDRDDNGQISGYSIEYKKETLTAIRLGDSEQTYEEMEEYIGDYYSDELGTTYTFIFKDGGLTSSHRRKGELSFVNFLDDTFESNDWWFSRVKFIRDDDNIVKGFRLSGGRVKNLWFEKR